MDSEEYEKRAAIISSCLEMNRTGINQGTSGNISVRHGDGLLITPTSMPYDRLEPEDIVFLAPDGTPQGRNRPSSEWRFHRDILASRTDLNAVVHAHPTYCTTLAILGKKIPPLHYMVAVCGGSDIRCAPYALFGSAELSAHALTALEDRTACLLKHHGVIVVGSSLATAMWRMVEVETLARQYHACLATGTEPPLLSDNQIEEVLAKFNGYGLGQQHDA
ncbi:class II aldolase/adducin family protein [Defluviimonas sp. WL0050]|uniref:Class II aldolase/adducin family protein n=1 Tax=Albidovulum litorale TaxID=2984134 RepID=A0ABT2ZRH2_9RHOB|nr:class II aldolase/adducin family protein [Defluviimonas sp. WL0050]MCV2873756.1 class II aldolase/adducin family protein [Defluviimonas sp. WL0050]